MKNFFTLFLILSLSLNMLAQPTVITIRPGAEGKNAILESRNPDVNRADHPNFTSIAWTASSAAIYIRSLIEFDLSAIPADANIVEAKLNLYYAPLTTNQHANTSGSNESYLLRITESWDKTTVTWNNQPATTDANRVTLPNSLNPTQNYLGVDVSQLVRDMRQYGNYGFMLKLATEEYYRCLTFASGDYSDNTKHPELIVKYTTASGTPPAVPTNFTGIEESPLNIKLTWTDNASNEANYIVEQSTETPTNFQEISSLESNTNTTTISSGISNKTRYFFRVKAVDANGYYSYSDIISVITGGIAINDGDKTVCNTYHFDSGVNNPYRSLENFTQTLTPATPGKKIKFALNNLSLSDGDMLSIYDGSNTAATKLYDLTSNTIPNDPIIATNSEGKLTLKFTSDDDVLKAAGWEAFVSCETQLNAPHNFTANQSSASSIVLTWTDTISNETGFEIQRSVGGSSFTTITTTAANATTYNDNSEIYSGLQYAYRIRTKSTGNISTWSNIISLTSQGPIAPSNLTATSNALTSISLTWVDNSPNENKFILERATTPNSADFTTLVELSANTTTYLDEGLTTGTTYYYRVKAVNDEYSSTFTNIANSIAGAITMSNSTQSICGFLLLDPGGTGNYSNNEDKTMVLTPSEAGKKVKLTFDLFSTENNFDFLYIYDGANTSSPLIEKIGGSKTTPFSYNATNDDGIITLRFTSDGSGISSGFKAAVSCISIPNAPSSLSLVSATANSITINWTDNSTDETKFEIFSALSSNGTYSRIGEVNTNVTQFTHSGLLTGTTYYYKVRAVGSEASSNFSESFEAKTGGITAPILTSLSSPDNQIITINWQDNDATETGFKIERSLEANANFTEIGAVGTNVTTYSDNTVQFGTTYYYRVYAVNSTEQSSRSNVSYFVAGSVLMSNTEVTRCDYIIFDSGNSQGNYSDNENSTMILTPSTDATIMLTVESFSTESSYDKLYVYDGNSTSSTLVATLTGSQTVEPIYATNAAGQLTIKFTSDNSSTYAGFKLRVNCIYQLEAPSDLSVQSVTSNSISLFWRDNTDYESGYKIYRSTSLDGEFTQIGAVNQDVTTFTDNNLDIETTYYYRVKAWNENYNSDVSNTVSSTTQGVKAPSALTAQAIGENSIMLNWIDNSNTETGYTIERSLSASTGFEPIMTIGQNATSYIDFGNVGTTYYYQVKAIANATESAPSNVTSVKAGYVFIYNGTADGCNYYLLDSGGEGDYANNEEKTITLLSQAPNQKVKLVFQSFNLENNFDFLYIYDGESTSDPLIASLTGTTLPDSVWATNSTGSLTLRFDSDDRNAKPGFIAKVSCTYIPQGPTSISLVNATSSSIEMTWNNTETTISEFLVYRSLTENGNYELIARLPRLTINYKDENLESGTQYFYKVYSSYFGHLSINSANLATETTGCKAPSDLSVKSTSSNNAILTWTDNSANETGFAIERSLQANTGFEVIATTSVNATSYNDASLDADQTYYYRVKATSSTESSNYTSVVSVLIGSEILDNTEIVRCNYTLLDNGGLGNYLNNTTSWSILTPSETGKTIKLRISEFNIETNKDFLNLYNGSTAQSPIVDTYTGTSIPDTLWATNSDGKLYLRLTADASNNASGFRIYVGCVDKLLAPSNLVQISATKGMVNLQWTDNSQNEVGFKIYRSTVSDSGFEVIASLSANTTNYADNSTVDGNTYYYKVLAFNNEITSDYSNTLTATANPNAISEDQWFSELMLYPNPTKDFAKLMFNSLKMGAVKVEIYSVIGNLFSTMVFEKQTTTFTEKIGVDNLPKGLYFVKVTMNDKTVTLKLNKN